MVKGYVFMRNNRFIKEIVALKLHNEKKTRKYKFIFDNL